MKQHYNIKNDEGVLLGTVEIDVGSAALDFALTPIVEIGRDAKPEVIGFLASQRTGLDNRPREEAWPHRHLGHRLEPDMGATLPDIEETAEIERRYPEEDEGGYSA